MSVPKWKRGEGDLSLFIEAQELAIHVLQVTSNENIFTPAFQKTITDKINHLAIDIYLNLWKANHVKLEAESLPERLMFQHLALKEINDFQAIWDLGVRAFHIRHNKTDYIIGKLLKIEEATKKWIRNDASRVKPAEHRE